MKKVISITLALIMLACLYSCGKSGNEQKQKPGKTSDAMYQIGLNALSVVDDYIGGKITGKEADGRIDEFYDQAKAQYEKDLKYVGEDSLIGTDYYNDSRIEHEICMLSLEVGSASRGSSAMSDVMEHRDSLAETLGEKTLYNKQFKNTTSNASGLFTNKYSKEVVDKIKSMFEEALSAYNAGILIYEKDEGLYISIGLKRIESGAEYFFADMLKITINTAKQAKEQYDFEISELSQYFVLYKTGFNENTSGSISFNTKNLEKGQLIVTHKNVLKSEIMVDEAIELLKNNILIMDRLKRRFSFGQNQQI